MKETNALTFPLGLQNYFMALGSTQSLWICGQLDVFLENFWTIRQFFREKMISTRNQWNKILFAITAIIDCKIYTSNLMHAGNFTLIDWQQFLWQKRFIVTLFQLGIVIRALGTPNEVIWPGVKGLQTNKTYTLILRFLTMESYIFW